MLDHSFTTTMTVDRPADEVFDAITRPAVWWSTSIVGAARRVGDEIVFDSPGHHLWKFRVVALERPRSTVWRVLDDSSTDFVDDRSEWNATEVRFDLSRRDDGTEVRFTHVGLIPQFECFEACSAGWTGYIQHSLHDLVTTGRGQPGAY